MTTVPTNVETGRYLDKYDFDRFWRRVNFHGGTEYEADPLATATGECWLWTGAINTKGYGWFKLGGRVHKPHRVAYLDTGHTIPEGTGLDHLCRRRHCLRPSHLDPTDQQVNTARGAHPLGNRTHCRNGHVLTEANVGVRSNGKSTVNYCKTCVAESRARTRSRTLTSPR